MAPAAPSVKKNVALNVPVNIVINGEIYDLLIIEVNAIIKKRVCASSWAGKRLYFIYYSIDR